MAGKIGAMRRVGALHSLDSDERFVLSVEAGPTSSYGERWSIMFDEARQQIIRELRSASTLRVFLSLPDYLSWTEFRSLNPAQPGKIQLAFFFPCNLRWTPARTTAWMLSNHDFPTHA